ncbi:MAG: Fic family protein [Patescibacteria group bacterium]
MPEIGRGELSRDQQTERLLRFFSTARGIDAFHGKRVEDVFKDEGHGREFLDGMTQEDFFSLLNGTNGILRGKPKTEWTMDGGEVTLQGFSESDVPPREADKRPLFEQTFNAIKQMNQEGRALEDIALLAGASINAIHAYEDANGRTSRLVYTLLASGYQEQDKTRLNTLLGEDGRESLDVSPSFVYRYLNDTVGAELGIADATKNTQHVTTTFYEGRSVDLGFDSGVPEENREAIRQMLRGDGGFAFLAFYLFFASASREKEFVTDYPKHSSIRVDVLLPTMSPEQVTNIIESYWRLKKRRVELLIDCIQHPQKDEYQIDDDGEQTTLLDYFKAHIVPAQQNQADT